MHVICYIIAHFTDLLSDYLIFTTTAANNQTDIRTAEFEHLVK